MFVTGDSSASGHAILNGVTFAGNTAPNVSEGAMANRLELPYPPHTHTGPRLRPRAAIAKICEPPRTFPRPAGSSGSTDSELPPFQVALPACLSSFKILPTPFGPPPRSLSRY